MIARLLFVDDLEKEMSQCCVTKKKIIKTNTKTCDGLMAPQLLAYQPSNINFKGSKS